MRQLKYLSPTSLGIYVTDKVKFYLLYLSETKMKRDPQTEPMAIGSSFDAYVKNYLYEKLFGKDHDPKYELRTLFEAQVESQNRDKAWVAGKYVFEEYKKAGSLTSLMTELNASVTTPRFEFDLFGVVSHQREGAEIQLSDVPLLGKPDVFYTNAQGARVIHDWKVNGFYSKTGASPMQGYVRLREAGKPYSTHKHAFPMMWKGLMINQAQTFEMADTSWAAQLAIYMWLCGEEVGSEDCVGSIDQIVCRPSSTGVFPTIRIAEHRSKVSRSFQLDLFNKAQEAWHTINSGHYFTELTREDSEQRCKNLDNYVNSLQNPPEFTTNEDWLRSVTRPY